MNEIVKKLPPMLFGAELEEALQVLPSYDEKIRFENAPTRLVELSNLYHIYFPTQMSKEVYSSLYLSLVRSLEKKLTKEATEKYYENLEIMKGKAFSGIVSGADSFTILGESGVGKTSAVSRAINLIGANKVIEINNPYTKIVPCLKVETPHDSSVKGMLFEILRKIDQYIGTQYYIQAIRYHATVDVLLGSVSQALLNHVGVLVLDEVQHILNNRINAPKLIGALTQLINSSGVTICMVGMPVCADLFKQEQHLARRSLGVQYSVMKYDEEFYRFCKTLFRYQYVKNKTEMNDATAHWLYHHSNGNPSVIISLIAMAQELAILNGTETLDMSSLNEAYTKRMEMLHGFINTKRTPKTYVTNHDRVELPESNDEINETRTLTSIIMEAKQKKYDAVESLKKYIVVEEITI